MNIALNSILNLATIIASSILLASPVFTEELDRNIFCNKFPLNSRCEGFTVDKSNLSDAKVHRLDRDRFCEDFAFNSRCKQSSKQVIKVNLDRSGENDEWVRIEKQDREVKLIHTTRVKDGLVSGALNGALGNLVPIPLPFVEANKYDWEDHQVVEVAFKKDRCQANDCTIAGKNVLNLPQGTDIYAGLFTINYQEKDLKRSLSFRIPTDVKVETINTITVETN